MPQEYPEWPIIAHADVTDVDCGGCIFPVTRGELANITCNECGAIIRTVPVADLQRTYDELELGLSARALCTEICPHCGNVNMFPGWSSMMAYTCKACGALVRLSDNPAVERLFGPSNDD